MESYERHRYFHLVPGTHLEDFLFYGFHEMKFKAGLLNRAGVKSPNGRFYLSVVAFKYRTTTSSLRTRVTSSVERAAGARPPAYVFCARAQLTPLAVDRALHPPPPFPPSCVSFCRSLEVSTVRQVNSISVTVCSYSLREDPEWIHSPVQVRHCNVAEAGASQNCTLRAPAGRVSLKIAGKLWFIPDVSISGRSLPERPGALNVRSTTILFFHRVRSKTCPGDVRRRPLAAGRRHRYDTEFRKLWVADRDRQTEAQQRQQGRLPFCAKSRLALFDPHYSYILYCHPTSLYRQIVRARFHRAEDVLTRSQSHIYMPATPAPARPSVSIPTSVPN